MFFSSTLASLSLSLNVTSKLRLSTPFLAEQMSIQSTPHAVLAIFDIDGTLLVSSGREIVSYGGRRAAIHPLMEPATAALLDEDDLASAFSVSDVHLERSYAYAGEEDSHGDRYRLIESASVIEREWIVCQRQEVGEAPASSLRSGRTA